jgi:hypothetical protein
LFSLHYQMPKNIGENKEKLCLHQTINCSHPMCYIIKKSKLLLDTAISTSKLSQTELIAFKHWPCEKQLCETKTEGRNWYDFKQREQPAHTNTLMEQNKVMFNFYKLQILTNG